MFELNPMTLLRTCIKHSRLLQVLFVIACLGWLLLAITMILRPVDARVGMILFGFHLGTWYFALATRSALTHVLGLEDVSPVPKMGTIIDAICLGIVLFCQILFLLTVFHLLEA